MYATYKSALSRLDPMTTCDRARSGSSFVHIVVAARGEREWPPRRRPQQEPSLQQLARRHLWMHFSRMGGYGPDHEIPIITRGRGLLRLRRARQPLPRRALRPLLRQRRPRPHRVRRGRRPPGRRARLLHALELRPPAGDRTGGADRLAGARRPQPRLLHLRRLGGGRVGAEAGPQLPPHARQRPEAQGDRPRGRLPRHLARGALGDRDHRAAQPVRAADAGRLPRPQHQHLPLARGPRPALGGRRDRGADRLRGAGDASPR